MRRIVDLPQPEGPSRATNEPSSVVEVDVVERVDRRAAELELLAQPGQRDAAAGARRSPPGSCVMATLQTS